MRLNPVYSVLKKNKQFTYKQVYDACKDKVINDYYIKDTFEYFIWNGYIKKIDSPMPSQVHVFDRLVWDKKIAGKKIQNMEFADYETEPVYKYRVPPKFKDTDVFHKTFVFKQDFGNMKDPASQRPCGYIEDYADPTIFDRLYKSKHQGWIGKVTKNTSWDEICAKIRGEVQRGLYYCAIHENIETYPELKNYKCLFPIRLGDRSTQWQRIVDIGMILERTRAKFSEDEYTKKNKLSKEYKHQEMLKLLFDIDSETENMC
jgi:hypothetical protein